ncbi:SDR family NAD(P)-dependent oxidoreductase [Arthrobacter antioxidans]|uniref:SDR family NAD(P)-dependent oxidoreductase n=1 Tax=Arthrobacter antioxidans TaxID=2895818 RepID=UPI001FFF299E|nr:SDR family NAD(P)-dependent oxidoreductase [Arthrobacter antioxidans]
MTQTVVTSPTVLLTGFTSGIGARMLEELLEHPSRPSLVLLARGAADLEDALERARATGLVAMGALADLGDLGSVRTALEQIHAAQERGAVRPVDVVLLNAGAQFTSGRRAGAQGHELTFAVNVIAQHLLLRGLEPLLAAGAHAVLLGSSTHRGKKASFNLVPDPQWRDPEDLARPEPPADGPVRSADERGKGGVAYASSKLALVTLAHDWAERLAASGHRLNTYDPGLVAGTGLGRDMPASRYWVWKHVMPAMSVLPGASTPRSTARHAVRLALGDAHGALNGGYVEIGRVTRAEAATFAADRRERLWAWLEGAVRDHLPTYAASEGSR